MPVWPDAPRWRCAPAVEKPVTCCCSTPASDDASEAEIAAGVETDHLRLAAGVLDHKFAAAHLGADFIPQRPILPAVLKGVRELDLDLATTAPQLPPPAR